MAYMPLLTFAPPFASGGLRTAFPASAFRAQVILAIMGSSGGALVQKAPVVLA